MPEKDKKEGVTRRFMWQSLLAAPLAASVTRAQAGLMPTTELAQQPFKNVNNTSMTHLQKAFIECMISYVGIRIANPDNEQRPASDKDQVNIFNRNGKGGAWCADIMKHFDEMIANHTGRPPLTGMAPILSTGELIDYAKTAGPNGTNAYTLFGEDITPPPGSLINMGWIDAKTIYRQKIGIVERIEVDNIEERGRHTAIVLKSGIETSGQFKDWVRIETIDASIVIFQASGGPYSVRPLTVFVNPKTNETVRFFKESDIPHNPIRFEVGTWATIGYINPMDMDGAEDINKRLQELERAGNPFQPDGRLQTTGLLGRKLTGQWLAHIKDHIQYPSPQLQTRLDELYEPASQDHDDSLAP